ncbi:MAG: transglutaminaseTgpA domain-containing protein, partial [Caldisericaceae bacterium]
LLIYSNFDTAEPQITAVAPQAFLFSFLTYVMAFVIFLSIPRLSVGFVHGNSLLYENKSGFSDTVQISNGKIQLDNTVVMRIETDIKSTPIYISGLRYTMFSGTDWVRDMTSEKLYPSFGGIFGSDSGEKSTVYLEAISGTNVLFGIDKINGIGGGFLMLINDSSQDYLTDAIFYRTIKYDVFSTLSGSYKSSLSKGELVRLTQVPQFSADFINLSKKIVAQKRSDDEKIRAIMQYLDTNCKYSLSPNYSSIEEFVMKGGQGYCEHFATALAIMSRVVGIPTRLVSGYVTSELNSRDGYYIVRNSDAHTWVEAYIDGYWVRYDPTPPSVIAHPSSFSLFIDSLRMSWYRNIVSYDDSKQFELVNNVGHSVSSAATGILNAFSFLRAHFRYLLYFILALLLPFLLLRKRDSTDKLLREIITLIGNDKVDCETLREYALRKGSSEDIINLVDSYYSYRFGNAKNLLQEISAAVRRLKSKKHYLTD